MPNENPTSVVNLIPTILVLGSDKCGFSLECYEKHFEPDSKKVLVIILKYN